MVKYLRLYPTVEGISCIPCSKAPFPLKEPVLVDWENRYVAPSGTVYCLPQDEDECRELLKQTLLTSLEEQLRMTQERLTIIKEWKDENSH
jgi:hypothetical protein